MATLQVRQGQSIYDICLQAYGTLNLIFKLIQDNLIESIDINPAPGTIIKYDESLIANTAISQQNNNTNTTYTTLDDSVEEGGSFDNSFDDSFDV